MTLVACEIIFLEQLLKELEFDENSQIHLICDNRATFDKRKAGF